MGIVLALFCAFLNREASAELQTIKANSNGLIARDEWETEIDRDEPKLSRK